MTIHKHCMVCGREKDNLGTVCSNCGDKLRGAPSSFPEIGRRTSEKYSLDSSEYFRRAGETRPASVLPCTLK
jgi:hypothetical protein